MAAFVSTDSKEPWRARLTLPAYQVKEAARYAEVTTQTVRNWQHNNFAAGAAIAERKLRESLSYLQLQELAIVSAMRGQGIKLQKIRLARDYLRQKFSLEFPFSDKRVKSDGQDILMELKELGGSVKLLVANRGGQYVWQEMIGNRFKEFEYEKNLAIRWHVGGTAGGVVIDPRISFGAPAVKGVPTWALYGRYKSGEPIEDIASDFVITRADVVKALSFEGVTIH
jgi:uncharacterized protein (DUF433 family)/DNA-binding transcriptional MerR regulator